MRYDTNVGGINKGTDRIREMQHQPADSLAADRRITARRRLCVHLLGQGGKDHGQKASWPHSRVQNAKIRRYLRYHFHRPCIPLDDRCHHLSERDHQRRHYLPLAGAAHQYPNAEDAGKWRQPDAEKTQRGEHLCYMWR